MRVRGSSPRPAKLCAACMQSVARLLRLPHRALPCTPQEAVRPLRHGYDHVLAEKVLKMEEKVSGC